MSDLVQCIEVLKVSGRFSEAAMFAKTYCPSRVSELVILWKSDLVKNHFTITAEKVSDPMEYIQKDSFSDL